MVKIYLTDSGVLLIGDYKGDKIEKVAKIGFVYDQSIETGEVEVSVTLQALGYPFITEFIDIKPEELHILREFDEMTVTHDLLQKVVTIKKMYMEQALIQESGLKFNQTLIQ